MVCIYDAQRSDGSGLARLGAAATAPGDCRAATGQTSSARGRPGRSQRCCIGSRSAPPRGGSSSSTSSTATVAVVVVVLAVVLP